MPEQTSFFKKIRLAARRLYEIRKEGQIDILDEQGNPTGTTANIYEIHEHGYWHRSANVYIVNSRGEVLLHRRSKFVRTFPNMWSMSAAGHVPSGQSALEAAVAETREELGLAIKTDELAHIGTSVREEILDATNINNEFQDNFVAVKEVDIATLTKQAHEVGEIAWLSIERYRELIDAKDPAYVYHGSTPLFFDYYDKHIKHGTDKK